MKIEDIPTYQISPLASMMEEYINQLLIDEKIVFDISEMCVVETVRYFLRDIYRIESQQEGKVSVTKIGGYWGFWIRKIKPIRWAFKESDNFAPNKEIIRINERVALNFAIQIIVGNHAEFFDSLDPIRDNCKNSDCNKLSCVYECAKAFLSADNQSHQKYIIHSMRHRTFGPHHFVSMLDQLIFSSCYKQQRE